MRTRVVCRNRGSHVGPHARCLAAGFEEFLFGGCLIVYRLLPPNTGNEDKRGIEPWASSISRRASFEGRRRVRKRVDHWRRLPEYREAHTTLPSPSTLPFFLCFAPEMVCHRTWVELGTALVAFQTRTVASCWWRTIHRVMETITSRLRLSDAIYVEPTFLWSTGFQRGPLGTFLCSWARRLVSLVCARQRHIGHRYREASVSNRRDQEKLMCARRRVIVFPCCRRRHHLRCQQSYRCPRSRV
ncbi:hypothetical protein BC827DRAFT_870146 [Russula dissimulans]|nr:hypothetical protein BC827DRAFT_870146 [Russula dissimulans]